MMAKRLINKQFISADVETSVVNKLRDACGCDYTGKLMRMQRDIHASGGMMEKFTNKYPLRHFRARCDLFINILTVRLLFLYIWNVNLVKSMYIDGSKIFLTRNFAINIA
jgi:hypothetical protein